MDEEYKRLINNYFEDKQPEAAYKIFKKEKNIDENYANWFLNQCMKKSFKKGVELALKKGANINNTEFFPIERAIRLKDLDLCRYLIKSGANIILDNSNISANVDIMLKEQMSEPSQYLISLAAGESSTEILKFLIEKGMNIRANNDHPLGWACSHGNIENTLFILDNFDTDIDCMLISKETPLSWAINVENEKIIEILMKYGANLKAHNNFALEHAVKANSIKIAEIVLSHVDNEELMIFKTLLERFIDKNGIDDIKKSTQRLVMKKMLEKELKTNIKTKSKNKI